MLEHREHLVLDIKGIASVTVKLLFFFLLRTHQRGSVFVIVCAVELFCKDQQITRMLMEVMAQVFLGSWQNST